MALDPDIFDALIETIRRFVGERLRPLEERVATEDEVPDDIVRDMREMGLFGLSIPEGGTLRVTAALTFRRDTGPDRTEVKHRFAYGGRRGWADDKCQQGDE